MMFFMGIVAKDDMDKGIFEPSYILYRSKGTSQNRSGIRVYRSNVNVSANMQKLLAYVPYGNEGLIDFMSHYRTRDHMHKDQKYDHAETKKYYPQGGLFWFQCDVYGNRTGAAIFIKNVPDKSRTAADDGMKVLQQYENKTYTVAQCLNVSKDMFNNEYSAVKTKIPQHWYCTINRKKKVQV